MNELDLPTAPPLPAEVRERVLNTVLSEIDAPPRRRTAPLVAAAVVVMVLGAATATALSRSPSPEPGELKVPRPAVAPSILAPPPVEPEVPATPAPSSTPAPPDAGTAYRSPLERCKAAVAGNDWADEYPDADGWTVTEQLVTRGTDILLAIDNAFLCYVSPARVWVSSTTGVQVGGGVQVVRAGPDLFGLLNPHGLGVGWGIETATSALSSEPSIAKVQAIDLSDGVANIVNVNVHGVGGEYYQTRLPETAPDPIVVVDRPVSPRDSATVDGAALDLCVRPRPTDPNETAGLMNTLTRTVAGESEPELWQPLARIDQPSGDFALLAGIGDDYAGLCVRTGDTLYWTGGEFGSVAVPADGVAAINGFDPPGFDPPEGASTHAWLFALGADVARLEMETVWGQNVPCEVRPGLALCFGQESPPAGPQMTVRVFDADGNVLQQLEI